MEWSRATPSGSTEQPQKQNGYFDQHTMNMDDKIEKTTLLTLMDYIFNIVISCIVFQIIEVSLSCIDDPLIDTLFFFFYIPGITIDRTWHYVYEDIKQYLRLIYHLVGYSLMWVDWTILRYIQNAFFSSSNIILTLVTRWRTERERGMGGRGAFALKIASIHCSMFGVL